MCRDVEEAERYGGLETRRRRVASKRYGTPELWGCAACVLPLFASRALELWQHAAGPGTLLQKRYGDPELWRRAAGTGTWRRQRGIEFWRCAAGVASKEVWERWGSSVLLLLKFLAFVPRGSLVKPICFTRQRYSLAPRHMPAKVSGVPAIISRTFRGLSY